MVNFEQFTSDCRFKCLSTSNQQNIIRLAYALANRGYSIRGNWRDDTSSDGNNLSFEVTNSTNDRKNLVTLRPMKGFLKVEVYWGYSKALKGNKQPKVYYDVYSNDNIPSELFNEIDELYNYFFR